MTWRSPDGPTHNQIDHLIIDARHVSNLMDVRTFRVANINSDHYLLIQRSEAGYVTQEKLTPLVPENAILGN